MRKEGDDSFDHSLLSFDGGVNWCLVLGRRHLGSKKRRWNLCAKLALLVPTVRSVGYFLLIPLN